MNFHTLSYTETVGSWRCAGNSGRRRGGTFSCKVEKLGRSGFMDWHSNESRDSCICEKSRVTVKVPFSKETFDCTFRNKGIPNIENDDSGNVDCHITVDDVSKVLGEDWMVRGYKTSTETFVSKRELIHLWWGYKPRINYCHIECQRYFYFCNL